jgi:ABC-2 type transport system permease protein
VITAGTVSLRAVTRMEWRKLRTVRSTWWIMLVFAAAMVGLAVLAGATGPKISGPTSYDPTANSLLGGDVGQLVFGVLGVLALSTEFSSGLIRSTFAAVPRRGRVLTAKAAVLAAVTFVVGVAGTFAGFAAFGAAAPRGVPHDSLGHPGVLRALLLGAAYFSLIALIGLGLAAVIRHTAGAISVIVAVVFVLPLAVLPLGKHIPVAKFLPENIAVNSLIAVKPVAGAMSPGTGFAVLCLYATAALAAGGWALTHRDA